MPQSLNDPEAEDLAQGGFEPGQRRRMRQMQRRMNVRIRAAEAQEIAARAMEKNARYVLWSVIIASAATIVTAAAAVFSVFANLSRAPH